MSEKARVRRVMDDMRRDWKAGTLPPRLMWALDDLTRDTAEGVRQETSIEYLLHLRTEVLAAQAREEQNLERIDRRIRELRESGEA